MPVPQPTSPPGSHIRVIGVGNEFRSDDGAGIFTAQLISENRLPGVEVIETFGEGVSLMSAWKEAAMVVIVDAIHSGSPAGTIYRFDAIREQIPARTFRHSNHTFSIVEAIETSRALGTLPDVLVVYGIEGENFSPGIGLTTVAERAAEETAHRICSELRQYLKIN